MRRCVLELAGLFEWRTVLLVGGFSRYGSDDVSAVGSELEALRRSLVDEPTGMVRPPEGAFAPTAPPAPGALLVRESVFSAFADLVAGRTEPAVKALESVLAFQYPLSDLPFAATFKVLSTDPDPDPFSAVEWVDFDPNWRQFVGVALALIVERFEAVLPPALTLRLVEAVRGCVVGEPEDRIPDWYTNPALMAAWCSAWVGMRCGMPELVASGVRRRRRLVTAVRDVGDVAEYVSPTYDGVDLFAAGLWVAFPPVPGFAADGEFLLSTIGTRVSELFHPELGACCGPYVRAYGLSLDRYVSLVGLWLWLLLAGAPRRSVLPDPLSSRSVHVHDLFFLPLFASVADAVVPHLVLRPVSAPRSRVQRFDDRVSVSVLDGSSAVGVSQGWRPVFARDQFVACSVHVASGSKTVSLGVGLGERTAVDAFCESGGVVSLVTVPMPSSALLTGGCSSGVVRAMSLLCSEPPVVSPGFRSVRSGPFTVVFDVDPVELVVSQTPVGFTVDVLVDVAESCSARLSFPPGGC